MSTLCGFGIVANTLLRELTGTQLSVLGLFLFAVLLCFYIAFRDIRLSARTMLAFEGLALLFVLILGAKIWSSTGFAIDWSQLTLQGATPGGALAGVVLVIFAFSGFESSTALGDEAKDPLRVIPRSVLHSVVLAGLFFIVTSYVVVLGFGARGLSLSDNEAPLTVLADATNWRALGVAINVGVLLSFLSCTLASINSTARILFSMARHGLILEALGSAHANNRTPHVAVGVSAFITFCVPAALYSAGFGALESQGLLGTLCSFGFIVAYILISIAAPAYLWSLGKLTKRSIAYAVGGVTFMVIPLLGSLGLRPGSKPLFAPDAAGLVLLAIFGAYVGIGLAWLQIQRARQPRMVARMTSAIRNVELQFVPVAKSEGPFTARQRRNQ
ncbi:MAG: APC family permease [Bacteroidota bacterium]